jgi:hypothetical protein
MAIRFNFGLVPLECMGSDDWMFANEGQQAAYAIRCSRPSIHNARAAADD